MLKLVTWNVNSINARLERLLAFLAREAPDVVCLQELKCVDEKFPFEAVEEAGYKATVYGQKTYNGVAILSKIEPKKVMRGFGDSVDDPAARFIAAEVHPGLTVMCAYVPNGQAVGSEKYAYKLQWLDRLRAYLERRHKASDQVILLGDFNVAPTDQDVHDPTAWREQVLCSTKERQALAHVMAFGLDDAFRLQHPDETIFSWWDYRMLAFPRNNGLRIDLILSTTPMTKLCKAARVDRDERKGEKASDHAPVIAEFDV